MDFKAWTEALRSGEYEQCTGQLHDGTGFCCIGVAAAAVWGKDPEAFKTEAPEPDEDGWSVHPDDMETYAPTAVEIYERFVEEVGANVKFLFVQLNDNGVPFDRIAGFAEAVQRGEALEDLQDRASELIASVEEEDEGCRSRDKTPS